MVSRFEPLVGDDGYNPLDSLDTFSYADLPAEGSQVSHSGLPGCPLFHLTEKERREFAAYQARNTVAKAGALVFLWGFVVLVGVAILIPILGLALVALKLGILIRGLL
jgi:hypothetical protein